VHLTPNLLSRLHLAHPVAPPAPSILVCSDVLTLILALASGNADRPWTCNFAALMGTLVSALDSCSCNVADAVCTRFFVCEIPAAWDHQVGALLREALLDVVDAASGSCSVLPGCRKDNNCSY
jgi:hypothetical protein